MSNRADNVVLLDARNIPFTKSKYYRNLNNQILGGILQVTSKNYSSEEIQEGIPYGWSYHVYKIKTRGPVFSDTLRDLYPMW